MRSSSTVTSRRVVLVLVCMAVGGAPAETTQPKTDVKLLITGNFESGDLKGWRVSGNTPTVTTSPTRVGKFAMKTSLDRQKDKVPYRTEVSGPRADVGKEYWYGFSIYLPNDYPADRVWEIVAQWHGSPDFNLGETWRNPVMALSTTGGRWSILNRWDAKRNTFEGGKRAYDGSKQYDFGPYRKGVWTDWVVHVQWSYRADGVLQIWQNGKKVVDRKGPNTFNDAKGPYFKMGIYKGWKDPKRPSDAVTRRVLYHDEFRMAGVSGRYEDVAPGGKTPDREDSKTTTRPVGKGARGAAPTWWLAKPGRTEPKILRWAREHPLLVSLKAQKTFSGHTAYAVTVTDRKARGPKHRLLVAQPHAHEPATTAGMMSFLSQLITGTDLSGGATGLDRKRILARLVITMVPDGNPDGRSRAPAWWWDGKEHTNDEFLQIAFGRTADGQRRPRLGRWSLADQQPARVGIVYERINKQEYVEPNRDRDSTFFRLVSGAIKAGPPDRFLSLHQTEFQRSKHNAMIILPFMQAKLPAAIAGMNERWALTVVSAWRKVGAAPAPKPRALGYGEDQLKYFRRCWSDVYRRIPTITVEVQNNNTRTPPKVQMQLQIEAIRATVADMLAGDEPS